MNDDHGPSHDTLKHLHEVLPTFVKGMEEKRTIGKGRPVILKPRKVCKVCGLLFDKISTHQDVSLESVLCEKCDAQFKEGCIALVCGENYAFIKSKRLSGGDGGDSLVGQVVHLQAHNMEKIQKEYDANWKPKEKSDADIQ